MTRKIRFIFAVLILLLISIPIWFLARHQKQENIKAVGLIEGQEVNISSKIFGRIIHLPFEEGDLINKGDKAVGLEAREIKAQILEAGEEVKRVKTSLVRLKKEKKVSEANLAQARERLHQTEITRNQAKRDYQRAENLWKEGVISQERYDRAGTEYLALEASVKAASAEVEEAKVLIAHRKASVQVLKTRLEDAEISSPITGLVAKKYFELGEIVSPGVPILTLWNLNKIWAKVYLDEKRLPLILLGMPARAWVESLSEKSFSGKVVAIGPEGEFSTQRDVKRGRQDIRAFRIKIALKDPAGILKPGMSVQIEFQKDEQYH
jgi:multidrug resistance efflux pump